MNDYSGEFKSGRRLADRRARVVRLLPQPTGRRKARQALAARSQVQNGRSKGKRRLLIGALGVVVLAAAIWFGVPFIQMTLNTVSTDDAYVNGHVTFVAARVAGQVSRVLVDDNNRVHKGDVLVELDKEPFQIAVAVKRAPSTSQRRTCRRRRPRCAASKRRRRSQRWKLAACDRRRRQPGRRAARPDRGSRQEQGRPCAGSG